MLLVCASLLSGSWLMYSTAEPLEHFERNRRGADAPEWDELGMMQASGYPQEFEEGDD